MYKPLPVLASCDAIGAEKTRNVEPKGPIVKGVGAQFVESLAPANEIFVPGQKIHFLVEGRQRKNRVVVFVEEFSDEKLVLSVHETEQAMLELEVGHKVELGFGFQIARMHFVCAARVLQIDGTRVTVTRPGEAKKQPRRGFARVAYRWPVRILLQDGSVHHGETRNVSASGALIDLQEGPELCLDLEQIHSMVMTSLDGRSYETDFSVVRSLREVGKTAIAIHFVSLPEVQRVHLELQVLRGIARRYLRVAVNLECTLELGSGEQRIVAKGTTENASGGGALIRCKEACGIAVNMRGTLLFDLDGEFLTLTDVVVLRVLSEKDTGCSLVLEFPEIDYEIRLRLVEFLMHRLEASSIV